MKESTQESPIELYKCYSCGKQVFDDDMKAGKRCPCGGNEYKFLQPTFAARLHYLLHTYGLRGLYEIFTHEVLPANDEPKYDLAKFRGVPK